MPIQAQYAFTHSQPQEPQDAGNSYVGIKKVTIRYFDELHYTGRRFQTFFWGRNIKGAEPNPQGPCRKRDNQISEQDSPLPRVPVVLSWWKPHDYSNQRMHTPRASPPNNIDAVDPGEACGCGPLVSIHIIVGPYVAPFLGAESCPITAC
ncbi:hypothetical protein BT63DRAFT_457611 [Microthyrium microscopicum]|uniref:Uncharacterized protein n=1 Tax=Microthyrium microscopicum TaxID=703497 RepID=A0A6A6U5E4_9PEZI|nr:hypothetical protein BT63DRAFT_457611 [Microthyrium microscopicum]